MFNYFTEIDNIYLISGNKILVFKNDNLINTINHHTELTFIKYNYVFDKNKILYKITGNNLIEIFKFPKAISQITRNEEITYISDRNSTIYQLSDQPQEITSNISYITDMIITDKLYISDKYGRIRISTTNGKILKYHFVETSPILTLALYKNSIIAAGNNYLAQITNRIEKIAIKGKIIKILIKEKIVLILENRILIKDSKNILDIEEYEEHVIENIIDGILIENNLYLVSRDGSVYFNFKKIYETKNNYDNYFSHLNH